MSCINNFAFRRGAALLCVASVLSGCATGPAPGTPPTQPGTVKVQYSTTFADGSWLKETPQEVRMVKRETTGKVVAAQVAFNILMLATGGGGGFQTFSKNELKGDRIESTQRDNLRNPTSTDFVRRLDDRVQAAMNADETLRQRAFEHPLVVAGGNARLVYDALAGTDEEKFALKSRLQIYKRKEATSLWSPSVIVDCAEPSGEPLPHAEWAANDYALVRTSLQSMLDSCEGAVLARLPELLKE